MQKINFTTVLGKLISVVKRFSASIAIAIVLFIFLVVWIATDYSVPLDKYMLQLITTIALGFSLSVALRVFFENRKPEKRRNGVELLIVVPLVILYFFLLPCKANWQMADTVRYIVFAVVSLLLIGLAPYYLTKNALSFWQYNIKIWWRFSFTLLCTGILYGGFALALLAFQKMFDVNVSDNCYAYLAAFFCVLFAPMFFLSGMPDNYEEDKDKKYPFLKIFGQYILLPILITYLFILYAYGLKILITWELPNGWLTWMTLIYSGVGLLVYFLLHNLYLTNENKAAAMFGKYFFFSEIPLVILLFIAILRRVSDYGITENRYFIMLVDLWIVGIAIYMIINKGKNFRPVLMSFAIVGLLSVVGPWNAFNVSTKSQYGRLEKLLSANHLLKDGKYSSNILRSNINVADIEQIKEIVGYFGKQKELKDIQPLFVEDLTKLKDREGSYYFAEVLFDSVQSEVLKKYFSINKNYDEDFVVEVSDYDYMIDYYYSKPKKKSTSKDKLSAYSVENKGSGIIVLSYKGTELQQFDLNKIAYRIVSNTPEDEISYTKFSREQLRFSEGKCKIIFKDLSGYCFNKDSSVELHSASLYILIKNSKF